MGYPVESPAGEHTPCIVPGGRLTAARAARLSRRGVGATLAATFNSAHRGTSPSALKRHAPAARHRGTPPDCRAPKNTIFGRSPDERAPFRSRPPCAGGGHPRRQVDPGPRPRLHERHAGPDPPGDAAAAARPVGRPEHRRLHQRLPRLAARRRRPDRLEGEEASRAPPREVPAGAERRPRRHQRLGHAAGQHVRGREVRRRLCDVVRQGPGRRSLRRCVQARQCGGHQPARRRAGAGRATTTGPSHRRCRTSPTTSSRPA